MDQAHGDNDGTLPPPFPSERGEPQQIGKYSIITTVGAGGMGTVYRGRSPDGHNVAIKLVHQHLAADAEFRLRLAGEADAGRRVPAFCSARVLDTGVHNSQPYLVTDYIDGLPLSQLIAAEGAMDLPRVHALALGMAAGLAAIHNVGLVHRDVKPSNVMLLMGGVRIIDFGIVRALDETPGFTKTGIVMGSLGWAAPEQLAGATPAPSMDIFSWGCVVAFAATATHPFGPGGLDTRAQRMFTDDPSLAGVPEPLRSLVARSLHRDPASRPTAQELLLALVGVGPSTATSGSGPVRQGHRRKALGVAAMAAALAAAALVVGIAASPAGDAGRRPADRHPSTAPAGSGHPSAAGQESSTGYQPGGGSDITGPAKLPPAAGSAANQTVTTNPTTSAASPTKTGASMPVVVASNAPTSADQCKNNGWKLFTDPAFKNQGECISYVNAH
jgi:serine/threonine protein kinase